MVPLDASLEPERWCFTVRPACCQRTYKPGGTAANQVRQTWQKYRGVGTGNKEWGSGAPQRSQQPA
jgi:hypothetical protein